MQCNVYKLLNSPDKSEQLCTPLDFLYSHCKTKEVTLPLVM